MSKLALILLLLPTIVMGETVDSSSLEWLDSVVSFVWSDPNKTLNDVTIKTVTVYYIDTLDFYCDSTWVERWVDPNICSPPLTYESGDTIFNPQVVFKTAMGHYPVYDLHTKWLPVIDTVIVGRFPIENLHRFKDWRLLEGEGE